MHFLPHPDRYLFRVFSWKDTRTFLSLTAKLVLHILAKKHPTVNIAWSILTSFLLISFVEMNPLNRLILATITKYNSNRHF